MLGGVGLIILRRRGRHCGREDNRRAERGRMGVSGCAGTGALWVAGRSYFPRSWALFDCKTAPANSPPTGGIPARSGKRVL